MRQREASLRQLENTGTKNEHVRVHFGATLSHCRHVSCLSDGHVDVIIAPCEYYHQQHHLASNAEVLGREVQLVFAIACANCAHNV